MMVAYLVLVLLLVAWKGYYVWLRWHNSYRKDMEQYRSLWEYLLGNGATLSEARRPFLKRALRRALMPVVRQWRLWAIVAAIGILVFIL